MSSYEYFKPKSLEEAFALMDEHPTALLIAGGTDLMVQIKNRELGPKALISLRSIEEFNGIVIGDVTCIGSTTTAGELIDNKELGERFPLLSQAALRLGSPQIRSVATVGGNVCNGSPCADIALALLALEARVQIVSLKGKKEVPLGEFFLGPKMTCLKTGEIMTGVVLDQQSFGARSVFMKKGRVMMDIATASLAMVVELNDGICKKARIAAGSVGPVPMRLKGVEKAIEGATLNTQTISNARKIAEGEVTPITDIRSTAEYRRQMVGVFTERSLEKLAGRDGP
jgi:carbon-monoxide dehydrogenase medium subunit